MHRQRITALSGTGNGTRTVPQSSRHSGSGAGRRNGRFAAVAAAVGIACLGCIAPAAADNTPVSPAATVSTGPVATVSLAAPKPTSTAASPDAPDPHPPLGGKAPDGSVPGGSDLAGRGLILPSGAPPLPKGLTARAWVLANLDTGEILAARDPHGRYQPASILKTLTAATILPHLPGSKLVTISPGAAAAEGSALGLLAGARYSVDQLFGALMLVSANDAAEALAEANGGVATTVAQMNTEAASLGAYDTYVQTPSGLDGWQQLTSAYDMTLVLRAALNEPRFTKYDELPAESLPAKSSKYGRVGGYQFDNQSLDFLQGVPGALVAKTGFTDAALHTYICAARRGGVRLGLVFLRNQRKPLDQYQQAAELLNWGFTLPRTIAPVGELAGPISARSASTAPAGAAPVHRPEAARPANPTPLRHLGSASIPISGAVFLLAAGCVAVLRLRRRRAQRRY